MKDAQFLFPRASYRRKRELPRFSRPVQGSMGAAARRQHVRTAPEPHPRSLQIYYLEEAFGSSLFFSGVARRAQTDWCLPKARARESAQKRGEWQARTEETREHLELGNLRICASQRQAKPATFGVPDFSRFDTKSDLCGEREKGRAKTGERKGGEKREGSFVESGEKRREGREQARAVGRG